MSSKNTDVCEILPIVPLRGLVAFPKMVMHFDVGRKISIAAIKEAMEGERKVLLVTQRSMADRFSSAEELWDIGCVARIDQLLKMPDGTVRVEAVVLYRAVYSTLEADLNTDNKAIHAAASECFDRMPTGRILYPETLLRRLQEEFSVYASKLPKIAPDIPGRVMDAKPEELGYISDYIAFNIRAPHNEKQDILQELNIFKRAQLTARLISKESEILDLEQMLDEKVKEQMNENNREYFLREQMKAINSELYGEDSEESEFEEYYAKIASLNAPDLVKEKLNKEVGKLVRMPQNSMDGTAVRNYLDTCIELPWNSFTKQKADIKRSRKILNRDFYGMDKVKERVLEMLSIYQLAPDIKGQIICLVGPPGVGKTSIGKTIAECTGRRFARVSLGGVRDEAEIRGHRRTYVASMPGKIINAVKTAGSGNPLILLDEIDKLGNDYKGDPSSALLEVLDPEQNSNFTDHYLDMPYDLSSVLFIATANSIGTIPAPLLDRMEVIELSSYTREEKFNIAKKHLVARQRARHGLSNANFKITDKALYSLIDFYTRESGVRKLEREIAAVCRKSAMLIAENGEQKVTVDDKIVVEMLGKHRYEPEQILKRDEVGVVNGLAWTRVGGEIMQLEVAVCKGSGKLELTGSLGEVMQESARDAVTFVRCHAMQFGIDPDFYKNYDIHIHATEAAVPKDGPSAGVTIATALISALTGAPVRRDIAMTGEITIRGRVLAIGGLKEKSMAALRGGVKTVFIPKDNQVDLAELDAVVRKNLNFIPVCSVEEIIESALLYKNIAQKNYPAAPTFKGRCEVAVVSQ